MPSKEYLIQELKERIAFLQDYYNKMEEMGSTPIMLGIIAMKKCELEEINFIYEEIRFKDYETPFTKPIEINVSFEDVELMQYTGLKDKNGVKIFEGDILKYPDNDEKDCMGIVKYGYFNCSCCHAVFGFTTINYKGWTIDMLLQDLEQTPLYEVVGNIYENSEF